MSVNIYEAELQNVWLFGQSVLYTTQPVPRREVPEGWYCYDLRGTTADPERPRELVDRTGQNFADSILSAVPLMRGRTQSKLVQDNFWLTAVPATLADFCAEEGVPCPEPPEKAFQTAEESVGAPESASRSWVMGIV